MVILNSSPSIDQRGQVTGINITQIRVDVGAVEAMLLLCPSVSVYTDRLCFSNVHAQLVVAVVVVVSIAGVVVGFIALK